jgi:hypothetical protein
MEDARKQLALVETRISQPRIRCAAMGAVHDGGLGPAVASMLLEKPT